jgi:hypothetical protein
MTIAKHKQIKRDLIQYAKINAPHLKIAREGPWTHVRHKKGSLTEWISLDVAGISGMEALPSLIRFRVGRDEIGVLTSEVNEALFDCLIKCMENQLGSRNDEVVFPFPLDLWFYRNSSPPGIYAWSALAGALAYDFECRQHATKP